GLRSPSVPRSRTPRLHLRPSPDRARAFTRGGFGIERILRTLLRCQACFLLAPVEEVRVKPDGAPMLRCQSALVDLSEGLHAGARSLRPRAGRPNELTVGRTR
uniref:Ribonuclease P n=1 Tax=Macrostomum lignano TaxID=282301 RepID=A0A1I8FA08_9PLAT